MPTLGIVARAWRPNEGGLAVCAALLILYIAAGGFSRRRFVWFVAAELFLGTIFCSPLDLLAREYLFTAEAVERALIALVAPYLFLRSMRAKDSFQVNRYGAWLAGMGGILIWFAPGALDWALSNEWIRTAEYATLVLAGMLFWWPIHGPWPDRRMALMPDSLIYLAAATVWCSMLGLFLAFAQPGIYQHYGRSRDPLGISSSLIDDWNFSRETDQQTGGLLFWIAAAAILLSEVMSVYYRWYRSAETRPNVKGG